MKLGALLGPDVLEIVRDDPAALGEGLRDVHPADVSDLAEEPPRGDRLRVLENLHEPQLGNVLIYLGGETLREALTRLDKKRLAKALDALEPDDAARLLSILSEEKRAPVLSNMSARDAAAARGLLNYEDGSAGRLMTEKVLRVRPGWNVS